MCGIAGYYDKTGQHQTLLGATLLKMLIALGRRGPDSAGIALFSPCVDQTQSLRIKLGDDPRVDYDDRAAEVLKRVRAAAVLREHERNGEYLRLVIGYEGDPRALPAAIEAVHPAIEVISFGDALDIVKQVGSPENLSRRFGLAQAGGTHAIAHTRLSTESKIDLSHSQPFWAHGALDLATVHNGHITNYHKLRRQYEQRGVRFYTDNDSEIIGIFLAERLAEGANLQEALLASTGFFDGSYSYLAATATELGFAKDPFGLKPLIVAESDAFVAIATEEIALQAVMGAETPTWEPPPGAVQTWQIHGQN